MSEADKLDDFIKDKLDGYSPEVPSNVWENIEGKKNRKRPVAFWWNFFTGKRVLTITCVLLLVAVTGLIWTAKTATDKLISSHKIIPQQVNEIPVSADNLSAENHTAIIKIPGEKIKNESAGINHVIAESNTSKGFTVDESIKKDGGITISSNKIARKKMLLKQKILNAIQTAGADFVNDNFTDEQKKDTADNNAEKKLLTILFYDPQKITSILPAQNMHIQIKKTTYPDCPEIEKNAAGNKKYVEFYISPDYALRSFSDTANSAYLQKRKGSTRLLFSFSAGLRYTKVFSNGVSFRTGINFSQINEKFSYVASNVVQTTFIINPATGDTTGNYTTTGTQYKNIYNHYRTIDIPLLAGYEMGNGKLHTNISAGPVINCYSWQKGEVLDVNNKPVDITTGKSNSVYQYKTNVGVGFTAAVSFYYKMNERWHLLAEPYFRYNLMPVSKEEITLKQKYNTLGLRLGVRLDLH